MLNQSLARLTFKHDLLILAVWLAFGGQALAQKKNDPPKQDTAKSAHLNPRCQAKAIRTTSPKPPNHWNAANRERYLSSPRFSVSVDEAGAVTEAKITRTSGIKEIDAWVRRSVKAWKYNPAPGCGIREGHGSANIDFY